MSIFKTAATAASVALMTGSALAADLPSRKAPVYVEPVPVFTWSGFHIGVNAGARFSNNTTATTVGYNTFTNTGNVNPAFQTALDSSLTNIVGTGNRTGALIGAQAGYDYQFYNSFLIGIEADAQGVISPGSRGLFGNLQPIGNFPGTAVNTYGYVQKRTDWLGTVRARLGYTITPAFLLYATGGLAVGGVTSSTATSGFITPPGASAAQLSGSYGGYSTNRVGYAVGAGGEWMFAPGFSLKAEYLYYDLGNASYNAGVFNTNFPGIGLLTQEGIRTRVRFDGHIARLGLNYHFWGPPAAPVVARY